MPSFSFATSMMRRGLAAWAISMSDFGDWCCEAVMGRSIDWKRKRGRVAELVMPGLVPGIHVLAAKQGVDGRDKPGNDVESYVNLALIWRLTDFAHSPASI